MRTSSSLKKNDIRILGKRLPFSESQATYSSQLKKILGSDEEILLFAINKLMSQEDTKIITLYLIEFESKGILKIGRTDSLQSRLSTYRCEQKEKPLLIYKCDGLQIEESLCVDILRATGKASSTGREWFPVDRKEEIIKLLKLNYQEKNNLYKEVVSKSAELLFNAKPFKAFHRIDEAVKNKMQVNATTTKTISVISDGSVVEKKYEQVAFTEKKIMKIGKCGKNNARKYLKCRESMINEHHEKVLGIIPGGSTPDDFNRRAGRREVSRRDGK